MNRELNNTELKKLGYSLANFQEEQMFDFVKFISHFSRSGKAPKGMKKDKEKVDLLHKMVEMHRNTGLISGNIAAVFSYYQDKESMDKLVDSFTVKEKIHKLKMGRITFVNESSMGNKRFDSSAKEIFATLKSLKGFHRLAIEKPLEIHFKKASQLRSKATYKSIEDEIWIKDSAKPDPEEQYGHLQYIIIHELGHRFERKNGHPEDFREYDSYTTRYSRAESMSGCEAFAELFALSHWEDKYPEYEDKISKFKKDMNEHYMKKENSMDF